METEEGTRSTATEECMPNGPRGQHRPPDHTVRWQEKYPEALVEPVVTSGKWRALTSVSSLPPPTQRTCQVLILSAVKGACVRTSVFTDIITSRIVG